MSRWRAIAAGSFPDIDDSQLALLEILHVPWSRLGTAADVEIFRRGTVEDAADLADLLAHPRHRHVVQALVHEARFVPPLLLRPMLLAAARTVNPSSNGLFVVPCVIQFGRRAVVETLDAIAMDADADDDLVAGALNARYWNRISPRWGWEHTPRAPDAAEDRVDDLLRPFADWAAREFVRRDSTIVRRSLLSWLSGGVLRGYQPPELAQAIAIARAHDDPYIRQRVAAQLGESSLLPALPPRRRDR